MICECMGYGEFRFIDPRHSSVLIDLAPSYFRYMETTVGQPTVLAKLLGFYTVEIKNLESGNTQAKADLLLMENLFYDQKIGKAFDLKGIQGRKVKAGSSGSSQLPKIKTFFDGEWIEGGTHHLAV
jgi:1-phosphatidylinositol-3-phosphate 5-kinase